MYFILCITNFDSLWVFDTGLLLSFVNGMLNSIRIWPHFTS